MTKFFQKISEEGVYITILGISENFKTTFAEMIYHIKGANYVIIKDLEGINKYLVEDFYYICFPDAIILTLEVTSPYLKIERVVDSGKEGVKETFKKIDWNLVQL